jgi:hypothetical protein
VVLIEAAKELAGQPRPMAAKPRLPLVLSSSRREIGIDLIPFFTINATNSGGNL